MKLRYTPQSQRDIAEIYEYIAEKNPTAAQRVEDHVHACLEVLEDWPGIGPVTDLEDVRRLPIVRYPYTIFYCVHEAADEVHVLRVIHGARVRDVGTPPDEA